MTGGIIVVIGGTRATLPYSPTNLWIMPHFFALHIKGAIYISPLSDSNNKCAVGVGVLLYTVDVLISKRLYLSIYMTAEAYLRNVVVDNNYCILEESVGWENNIH